MWNVETGMSRTSHQQIDKEAGRWTGWPISAVLALSSHACYFWFRGVHWNR